MLVLDLFCGLKGFSQAFAERGHDITTVDILPKFQPTICADIMKLTARDLMKTPGYEYDIILASPPCTEFSKSIMPDSWNKNRTVKPDTKLLEKTIALINELNPQFWIIENVSGARKFFMPFVGKYKKKVGSRYLWGKFPIFYCKPKYGKWLLSPTKDRAELRSLIPYELSLNLCIACERFLK